MSHYFLRASLLIFASIFSPVLVFQAPAMASSNAIKFYKSPRSFFPSGESNLKELEKNWFKDSFEFSYFVQKEKKQFWVQASSVARDLHLSEYVYSNERKQTYKVLQISGSAVLGSPADGKTSAEWLPLSSLTPLPDDRGIALTLISTQIRESPSWKSDSVLNLPPGSRLQILKFEDTWAQVTFESVGKVSGWVDLSNLLLKHDFAAFALWGPKNRWLQILYREGSELVTADDKRIPLSEINGLMTKPDLAISLITDDSEHLLLRQNLHLLKTEAQAWSLSRLAGHGEVFWKKSSSEVIADSHFDNGISIEELMKREVVAVSFHPQNPNYGVVSAQGIYLTTDGKTWRRLAKFSEKNEPVLIDEKGVLYVGSQKSTDFGKSFSPYFRWELLAQMLEQKKKTPAQQLKIRNLTNPRPGVLRMELETNRGPLRLAARTNQDFISKWDYD
jgi:hypothetical protein